MIKKITLKNFTAFSHLVMECSPGINVLIGANGTGKTHLLKMAYAACDVSKNKRNFAEKIVKVFLPSGEQIGRLVKRTQGSSRGGIEIVRTVKTDSNQARNVKLGVSITNHTVDYTKANITGNSKEWTETPLESAYIPVKEMLSNAPGFRSLYSSREIAFEEVYADIVDRALLPLLKGPTDKSRAKLLAILQKALAGKVTVKNEEFFLKNKQGDLEFTLLAEGLRKLALIWVLIQNGCLLNGSVLFWDEPEANLNPKLMGTVVDILLELQKAGVQIFLATHDYVFLKELDLRRGKVTQDNILFHALYHDSSMEGIAINSSESYLDIHPNAIAEIFNDLYNRDVRRALGGGL